MKRTKSNDGTFRGGCANRSLHTDVATHPESILLVKSYKTELDPNNKQRTAFLNHAGAARWAYNWGLSRKIEEYAERRKSPSAVDLHRELVVLKKTTHPWLYNTSKCAPSIALRHLDVAFKNFFRRCKESAKQKGFPKFKSRKRGIGSFTLTGQIHVTARSIQLPRIGIVQLKERSYIPTDVRIKSATVSERAGRWFVSVQTAETPVRKRGTEILGVDVGIKHLAVLSDGTIFENPKALASGESRLRRLSRLVSRKVKGSQNWKKAVAKLARQHYRAARIRLDSLHKASDVIAKRSVVVGIETLNVAGMMRNHHLAKSISDAGLSELHRQLTYKMAWAGGVVVRADRFFPSSKTCSKCGLVKENLALSERTFRCGCGFEIDRDLNAARNLQKLAASLAVSACGEDGARGHSMKQEPNTIKVVA